MMSDRSKEDFYNFFNQFNKESLKLLCCIGCDADGRTVVLATKGVRHEHLLELFKQAQEGILLNNTVTVHHGSISEL